MTLRRTFTSAFSLDWLIFGIAALLVVIGLAGIYSVELSAPTPTFDDFRKQLIAAFVGFSAFVFCARVHISSFRLWARPAYVGALALLVSVLIWGATIRGTRGWFYFSAFSFQPVEFAKIAAVLYMARAIERWGRTSFTARFLAGTGMGIGLLAVLILLEPDVGSAFLFVALWGGMLLLVGIRRLHLFALFFGAAISLIVAWNFLLAGYQKDRILTFLDASRDPRGRGYNITQSVIAVGSGQLFGRGLGFGSQSQLRFLPERHTDFIFATLSEELGFFGALTVISLYAALVGRMLLASLHVEDDFTRAALLGIATLFSVEIVLNIGMNVGFLPVTGITLPFLSYGGSSLVAHFLLLGIAASAVRSRRTSSVTMLQYAEERAPL